MSSFGERLRQEREARRTTIEQISLATGIKIDYLEALEKGQFHLLPGRAFGKLYIRAYARILGFDPRPLIEQYDREREAVLGPAEEGPDAPPAPRRAEAVIASWRQSALAARHRADGHAAMPGPDEATPEGTPAGEEAPRPDVPVALPAPAAIIGGPRATGRPFLVALLLGGTIALLAVAYWGFFKTEIEASAPPWATPPAVASPAAAAPPPAPPPHAGPKPAEDVPPPPPAIQREAAPRPPSRAPRRAAEPSPPPPRRPLAVEESGVGRKVVQHRLVDAGDRFSQWDAVSFSTRVTGGAPGSSIRHVWIREGRVVQSMRLRIGGPDWRTHSRKTLGQPGRWAVEARDEEGRLLARAEFLCEP